MNMSTLTTSISLLFILSPFYTQAQKKCLEFHVIQNAPLGFKSPNNENLGVHWEYLAAIEKESGLCINKSLLPYTRIWHSMEHGLHDGGIVFKSNSRSSLVEYVALIRSVKTVVIPFNGIKIRQYNDLHGLIIGKTRGTHLSEKFDLDTAINIVALNNYTQAAQMIKMGRIDAIAGSALVLSYQLNMHNVLDNVDPENKFVLGKKEQWLQMSKKSKHLDKIPILQRAIDKLKHDGTFDQIMDKYYGEHWIKINH